MDQNSVRNRIEKWFAMPRISTAAILFTFFFVVYTSTIYGELRYGDEYQRYQEAQGIVERGTLEIKYIPANDQRGVDGKIYSQFEFGMGASLAPFFALGKIISQVVIVPDVDRIPTLVVNLFNPLVAALTCVVFFWFSRALGVREKTALLMTVVLGLGTIVWHYSKGVYREVPQAFLLLLATYRAYQFRQTLQNKFLALAGIALGWLITIKFANGVALAFFGIYFVLILWSAFPQKSDFIQRFVGICIRLTWFAIPVAIFLGVIAWTSWLKWGSPFMLGPFNYTPAYFSLMGVPEAIGSFLFSFDRSILIYAPPVILSFPAWVVFFRKHRLEALLATCLIAVSVVVVGSWSSWWDQSYWGPKYLVEFVPLMVLPIGLLWDSFEGARAKIWQVLCGMVFAIGFVVQIVAVLSNDREQLDTFDRWIDLRYAFDLVSHGGIDSLAFSIAPDGFVLPTAFGVWSLVVILILGLALFVRWRMQNAPTQFDGRRSWILSIGLSAAQLVAVIALVAIPYADVFASKGNSKYTAGNRYLAEKKLCEARSMYLEALSLGTDYSTQAMRQLDTIVPMMQGEEISIVDYLSQEIESSAPVELPNMPMMKTSLFSSQEGNVESATDFFPVESNTQYQISGWVQAQDIYGSGAGLIGWYEDRGDWNKGRYTQFTTVRGARGMQYVREIITTQAMTKRAMLKIGLWQAYGTLWAGDLRVVRVQLSQAQQVKPPCK
jgi:hypothetical protein